MAKLVVEHFGALEKCAFEVRKVTAFIGPQGSGKSTAARLYTAFSWLEKSLCRGSLDKNECTSAYIVKNLLPYSQLSEFLKENSRIHYSGDFYEFDFSINKLSVRSVDSEKYSLPKILYIPSERSFLSVLDDVMFVRNMPSLLYELAADYSAAINSLGTAVYDLPIPGFSFIYSKTAGGSLIRNSSGSYAVPLSRAASGLQSVLPLSIVFDYWLKQLRYEVGGSTHPLSVRQAEFIYDIASCYNLYGSFKPETVMERILWNADIHSLPQSREETLELYSQISRVVDLRLSAIIEEPEQNIFPAAQKELVEYLVSGINGTDGSSLLMTTHSPYILATLNNLIYAGELSGTKKNVRGVVSEDKWIRFDDVSAYYFDAGTCTSIMDPELKNIDPEKIDSCSRTINDEYEALEEIEFGR